MDTHLECTLWCILGRACSFTPYDMQSNRKPDNLRQEKKKLKKKTKPNEEYISKNESASPVIIRCGR